MNFPNIIKRLALVTSGLLLLGLTGIKADEQPFVTLYTTDLEEQDTIEAEQWLAGAWGHSHESFRSFESRTEFEFGIASNIQGSLYLNYDWSRSRPYTPGSPTDRDSFAGVSGELVYRLLDDERDPFGLALYVEPTWGVEERELETKILLQKNILGEALRFVVNINFEDNWDRDAGTWEKASALELCAGVAYMPTPQWTFSAEFSNEHEYDGLLLGGSAHEQSSSYYAGPTIQYSLDPITITLGAQAQLPWADGNAPGTVEHGFASSAERYRVLLRLSTDLD